MNDEDDNSCFGSMHIYMHLAFKELISPIEEGSEVMVTVSALALLFTGSQEDHQ